MSHNTSMHFSSASASQVVAAERLLAKSSKVDLTFAETNRARSIFMATAHEVITTPYELRSVLSEMGLYPPDQELSEVCDIFGNKISFNNFCRYLVFLKIRYLRPEPRDLDTQRVFVALGGSPDRTGDISTDGLRDAVKRFNLTIDIDSMIKEVDTDNSGSVKYSEFRSMWDVQNNNKISGEEDDHEEEEDNMVEVLDREEWETLSLEEQLRRIREQKEAERQARSLRRRESSMRAVDNNLDKVDPIVLLRVFLQPLQQQQQQLSQSMRTRQRLHGRPSRYGRSFRLPSISRGPSMIVNSTAAHATFTSGADKSNEGSMLVVSDDEVESPKAPAGNNASSPEKAGYRAPSPLILSQYAAIRNKGTGKLQAAKAPVPPPGYGLTPRTPRSTPRSGRSSRRVTPRQTQVAGN